MQLHFLPLFFFALDVDLPAQQLGRQPHVLALFADGQRQLAVVHDHFQMFFRGINHRHTAHFGRLQRLLRKSHRVFVVLDDVDLLAAQLADDALHPHALHAHACAHRIHVFVFGHHRDLGALAGLARNGADDHRAVVNLRDLALEQRLHQLGRRPRHHQRRAFAGFFHARDHHPHALVHGKRFQPRLLFARHARLGLAHFEDHVRAFNALHHGGHHFVDAPAVFGKHRVALRLAHFLEDHLFGDLRRDAS